MSTQKELRSLSSDVFEDYLDLVCEHLGFEGKASLPDGVGDIEGETGVVSYALSRDDQFAAFRWLDMANGAPQQLETFLVTPKSKPVRTAVISRFPGTARTAPAETESSSFLERWRERMQGETCAGSIPAFVEMVATLASRGRVTVNNAELLNRTRILESELEYARIELAETALELETARQNMRSTASARSSEMLDALLRPLHDTESSSSEDADGNTLLDTLPLWAADNAERIVILPRALNGAKKSQYQSPATIMRALEILAGPYRRHRMGEIGLADFEAALAEEGIQLAGSVGPSKAGEQGDQYFVQWGKRRRFLDLHLLKGGGREPRYCMRIYFFWDADTQRCVVGSMPTHLDNSLS